MSQIRQDQVCSRLRMTTVVQTLLNMQYVLNKLLVVDDLIE